MRISTSWNYGCKGECGLLECNRRYCNTHRLLWQDCDTAEKQYDSLRGWRWELKDCPHCEREWRSKKAAEYAAKWNSEQEIDKMIEIDIDHAIEQKHS